MSDYDFNDDTLEYNSNLVETHIKMIGHKLPISRIVLLLAYIRHAIQTGNKTEITVKIGNYINNCDFMFDVNDMQIDDYITKNEIEIS